MFFSLILPYFEFWDDSTIVEKNSHAFDFAHCSKRTPFTEIVPIQHKLKCPLAPLRVEIT